MARLWLCSAVLLLVACSNPAPAPQVPVPGADAAVVDEVVVDTDSDHDGLDDPDDLCPSDPEDADAFEDADGCPELDNDRDGIADRDDMCPQEPMVISGPCPDARGCPDDCRPPIIIPAVDPVPVEPIYFASGKATLRPEVMPIVDAYAQLLVMHPEVTAVRVEGHTDDKEKKKPKLAKQRAQAVLDALVERGVDASRLEAVGYGADKPVAVVKGLKGDKRDDARARNRRVELVVVETAP